MSTKAVFSNRIYKEFLENNTVNTFSHILLNFNRAKHFAAQTEIREKRTEKKGESSIHLRTKARYSMNDYYTNSAVQSAKASNSSQEELNKLYTKNKNAQIKSVEKKTKTTKSRLTVLKKIKQSFVKGKPKFNKTSREQQKGSFFIVQFKEKTDLYYNAYEFEHLYLDVEIKRLRSRIGRLTFKKDRIQKQLESLKRNTKSACFGTKKLAKARTTKEHYINNAKAWKEDWARARYSKMTISGRKDAKYGNFVFQYEPATHTLFVRTPDGKEVAVPHVSFPYGQESVDAAINRQVNLKNKKAYGKPIAWSLEDCGDYYIVKCIIDVGFEKEINYSKSAGIIGIDMNVDHFAVSNVNQIGQLTDSFCLAFDIRGKSSNQIEKIIEAEAIALVDYACRHNKPIALEDIDTTTSKVKNAYGNKKANQRMSMFAYKKMSMAIKNRAEKMGVAVFEVNPAYTSQIGKIKYMKRLGISIHQAASYVIARRAMGFKEKLPPVLHSLVPEQKQGLHHWTHWAYLTKNLSVLRTDTFYGIELCHFDGLNDWRSLFPQKAFTDFEEKGLPKWKSRKSYA